MPAIILPDRWMRQPTGPLSLDQGNHLAQKATAVAVPFGGAVRILTNGKKSDQLGYASGANIRVVGGRAGLGVDGSTSSIDSMRLHSVVNQTDTAWEAPSSAGTWIAVFERLGNSGGSSYLFGNVSPSSSPYTSWGLHDAGGTGSLKVDCSAGGSYRENTVATMGNNTLYVAGGRYNGKNLVGFINGVFSTPTACTGNISYLTHSDRGPAIANFYNYTGENRSFNGRIYLGVLWDSALSDAEIAEFTENPWQVFAKKSNILYFPSAGGGGATDIAGALESISLSTFGATVGSARAIAGALESLSLTPYAATVGSARAITAAVESISLGTYAATVSRDTALAGGLESIALTANAASITLGAAIAAALEAIVLATNPAAVALDAAIAAQLEQITITGLGATVSTSSDVNIGAALESITLSVPQALVSSDRDIAGGLESIQITAHGATVTLGALIQAALEQISVQSLGAGITLNVTLAGGLEQINLTTLAAQIGLGSNVAALVEAITLTEFGATLTMTGEIAAALESIGLTTFVATVVGGESALTTPGLEFTIPVGRMHYAIPIGRIHFTIPRD